MAERWEYKTEQHTRGVGDYGPYWLDSLGEDGWELMAVSIVAHWNEYDGDKWQTNHETYIFKRKAGEAER